MMHRGTQRGINCGEDGHTPPVPTAISLPSGETARHERGALFPALLRHFAHAEDFMVLLSCVALVSHKRTVESVEHLQKDVEHGTSS
jgi:hypothetical protein